MPRPISRTETTEGGAPPSVVMLQDSTVVRLRAAELPQELVEQGDELI